MCALVESSSRFDFKILRLRKFVSCKFEINSTLCERDEAVEIIEGKEKQSLLSFECTHLQ